MEVMVCALEDIPAGTALGFQLPGPAATLRVLLARAAGRVVAYANRCPHTGVNLDWVEGQFMDADGVHLQCATHGALFRVADGFCVFGPCAGQALTPIPARVAGGNVLLAIPAEIGGPGANPACKTV